MRSLSESSKNSKQLPLTQTVLEGFLGHRAFDPPIPKGLKSELLTYWGQVWLSQVFKGLSPDTALDNIMGVLLSQGEYGLASDFSKFSRNGNWATYLKGRMHLALGDNTLASTCFQKAAFNLGE